MLDDKKIRELQKRVSNFISEGTIKKEDPGRYVDFFLTNAKNSLDSAKLLLNASTQTNIQRLAGLQDFNGFLWVINASYYSMFYIARALLEKEGIKIRTDLSVHLLTFDALVYYFYLNNKLGKRFVEDFAEAEQEAAELLGQEKAKELVKDYFYEKKKRSDFTYEMGLLAIKTKAQTSLERAKRFNEEIRKIIELK